MSYTTDTLFAGHTVTLTACCCDIYSIFSCCTLLWFRIDILLVSDKPNQWQCGLKRFGELQFSDRQLQISEEIMGAQNFNYAPKLPKIGGLSVPSILGQGFRQKRFPTG